MARQNGERRGGSQPSLSFGLTREAEALFPKSYSLALRSIIAVIDQLGGPAEVEDRGDHQLLCGHACPLAGNVAEMSGDARSPRRSGGRRPASTFVNTAIAMEPPLPVRDLAARHDARSGESEDSG
jgi:hypothetical protein